MDTPTFPPWQRGMCEDESVHTLETRLSILKQRRTCVCAPLLFQSAGKKKRKIKCFAMRRECTNKPAHIKSKFLNFFKTLGFFHCKSHTSVLNTHYFGCMSVQKVWLTNTQKCSVLFWICKNNPKNLECGPMNAGLVTSTKSQTSQL